jgi:lipoate-protein ligase A
MAVQAAVGLVDGGWQVGRRRIGGRAVVVSEGCEVDLATVHAEGLNSDLVSIGRGEVSRLIAW